MIPLVSLQRVLTRMCLCPFPDGTSKLTKIKSISLVSILIFCEFNCAITSIAYYMKFMLIDLKESLFSLFQIAAAVGVVYQIFIALFSKRKILGIIQGLNRIYEESKRFSGYLKQNILLKYIY